MGSNGMAIGMMIVSFLVTFILPIYFFSAIF